MSLRVSLLTVIAALLCLHASAFTFNIPPALTDKFKEVVEKGTSALYGDNPERLDGKSPRVVLGYTSCPCSPTRREASKSAIDLARTTIERIEKASSPAVIAEEWLGNCYKGNLADCIDADASLRGKVSKNLCTFDTKTKGNLFQYFNKDNIPTPNGYAVVNDCDAVSRALGLAKNEGCVAIEHLKGYVLQHRRHLMRPVLCGRGFCATPNHAIIVNGKTTSMKELCTTGGWDCIVTRKLVNNLKIAANTRAVAGDVTITPYDVRFPVLAIWLVQILEDAAMLVSSAIALAFTTAVVLLFLSKIDC